MGKQVPHDRDLPLPGELRCPEKVTMVPAVLQRIAAELRYHAPCMLPDQDQRSTTMKTAWANEGLFDVPEVHRVRRPVLRVA